MCSHQPVIWLGLGTGASSSPFHHDRIVASLEGEGLEVLHVSMVQPDTFTNPFGPPPGEILRAGCAEGVVLVSSPHGEGHIFDPCGAPWRAYVAAMVELGVTQHWTTTMTGSLRQHLKPGMLLLTDGVIDVHGVCQTWFDGQPAIHASMAHPVCEVSRQLLLTVAADLDVPIQTHLEGPGAYLNIRGPRYSTADESRAWRKIYERAAVVGQTKARLMELLRVARICSAWLVCVSDMDAWCDEEDPVTAAMVEQNAPKMIENASTIFLHAVGHALQHPDKLHCSTCHQLLPNLSHSDITCCTPEDRAKLAFLMGVTVQELDQAWCEIRARR